MRALNKAIFEWGNIKYIVFAISSAFCLAGCEDYKDTQNAEIKLSSDIVFKTGDSLAFSKRDYPDMEWMPIRAGYNWESQGVQYDGFAWYRIRFMAPSVLKKDFSSDSLLVDLGTFDDVGQIFLNGFLLNASGIDPTSIGKLDSTFIDTKVSSKSRFILGISDPRIFWDKKNIIAVRVFDRGRSGGLIGEDIYLRILSLADSVSFNKNSFYKINGDQLLDTNLVMANMSKGILKGNLEISYTSLGNNSILMKKKVGVDLKPGGSASFPVSIPFYADSGRIDLKYTDLHRKQIVREVFKMPFVLK